MGNDKRTGEITEDYITYFYHVFLYGMVPGLIIGAVGVGVYAYTNWYALIASRLGGLYTKNWVITVPATIIALLVAYLYIRYKLQGRKRNKKRQAFMSDIQKALPK
jgi:hypothetical protein